ELGAVNPEEQIFCENGQIYIGKHLFRDSKPHDYLTFREVIEKSSNIGTYKVSQKVGPNNIYKYSRLFGFGEKTGIELHGETPGILKKPSLWSKTSLSSISIGQEIGANALQIVNAYAAIANGGVLMKPYIVKAVTDGSGNILEEFGPEKIRRVVSKETAHTLSTFFKGVTETGTAVMEKINGKAIAGKTGTAQKIDPKTKGYSQTDYMSSFIGYFPAENPKIVGLIVLDTPRGVYYGGTVSAPAVREIFRRISHLPKNTLFASTIEVGETESNSTSFRSKLQSFWSLFGTPAVADETEPNRNETSVDQVIQQQERSISITNTKADGTQNTAKKERVTVPDVRGLTIREAIRQLTECGLDFEISGSGKVITQSLPVGIKVAAGTVAKISAGNGMDSSDKKRM
ncbi:penicillin-binding protein, partial [candidate division KSB1 bacterium]